MEVGVRFTKVKTLLSKLVIDVSNKNYPGRENYDKSELGESQSRNTTTVGI